MLTNKDFFLQSLVSNLYYLWTLREYSARIEVSLPPIYSDYINKSNELANRAEVLYKQVAEFAYKQQPGYGAGAKIIMTGENLTYADYLAIENKYASSYNKDGEASGNEADPLQVQ